MTEVILRYVSEWRGSCLPFKTFCDHEILAWVFVSLRERASLRDYVVPGLQDSTFFLKVTILVLIHIGESERFAQFIRILSLDWSLSILRCWYSEVLALLCCCGLLHVFSIYTYFAFDMKLRQHCPMGNKRVNTRVLLAHSILVCRHEEPQWLPEVLVMKVFWSQLVYAELVSLFHDSFRGRLRWVPPDQSVVASGKV